MLQKYGQHQPTAFDTAGAFLPNQQEWLLVPVSQTRDSGPLDQSNFDAALELLGGESDNVQVHRFGHWGPGWYEIIIINPAAADKVTIAEDIASRLEDYPVLNEEDLSTREWDDFTDSWSNFGARDLRRALVKAFKLSEEEEDRLDAIDNEDLRQWYTDHAREPYISEDSGVCIPVDRFVEDLSEDALDSFLSRYTNNGKAIEIGPMLPY